MSYRVRPGVAADVALLGPLEQAAAGRFAGIGLARIARGRPTGEAEYLRLAAEGRLWVVESDKGAVAGLAIGGLVDGEGYLAEISVHPDHAGQRLAARMIDAVAGWAAGQGAGRLYLTTFRDVPWNRPYYERLGFAVAEERDVGLELRAQRDGERARGLDRISPRVCMMRRIGKEGA